jgi:hypothetical protein
MSYYEERCYLSRDISHEKHTSPIADEIEILAEERLPQRTDGNRTDMTVRRQWNDDDDKGTTATKERQLTTNKERRRKTAIM